MGHRYTEYVTPSFVACSPVVRRNRPLRLTTGEQATKTRSHILGISVSHSDVILPAIKNTCKKLTQLIIL